MPFRQLYFCCSNQSCVMFGEFAIWGESDDEVNSYFGSFRDLCVVDAPDVFDDAGKSSYG